MTNKKGIIIGFVYGLLITLVGCALLEILVFSIYGGTLSVLTTFNFNILLWGVGVSFFPITIFFSWLGFRLSKNQMSKKQIWIYAGIAGLITVFFASSIGNIISTYIEHAINGYPDKGVNIAGAFKWAPVYALALLPFSLLFGRLAINGLSRLINHYNQ